MCESPCTVTQVCKIAGFQTSTIKKKKEREKKKSFISIDIDIDMYMLDLELGALRVY